MRLTALYVCGTLLAFSSLSWIRAEEGVLLGDRGFGPCTATLRPVGACRPGDHDNTCPFHVSLPPLVVHLPQHVLELENIMQDLQKLKESVDELREMCADCAGGQAARNCERKNEGELNGGKNTNEDEGDWLNERLEENEGNFKQACGKDGVKVETMDGNNKEKKLKDGNERETGGVVKENGRGEPVTEGARGEDTLKMPTSGGNMKSVNVTRGKMAEINPKGSLRKIQDLLDKNKGKTKEKSIHPIWQDKTKVEKNTKAEAIDRIKMSKNHTMNINKEQEQIEMEKGIKVDPNKKKPKQMERFGLTEKGREIKTESVQRDDDGETSSSKTTKKTDFLSISPTLLTTELTSRPDLSDSKSFTSSLPSPSLLSSTLSSITDVTRDPKAVYGLTGSTEPGAAGVTEPQRQVKGQPSTTTETLSTVGGPGQQIAIADVGLSITTPTTSSPLHTVFITSSSRVTDRSHGAPKKNINSKPKTNLKPPPVRASKPGEKHKSGIKPEADKRQKNAKNDHKPNQGPSTEEKPKLNQRNKPHKPTGVKFKPGKDSKQIQNKKPGQKNSTDISTIEGNLKSNLMPKREGRANETAVQRPAAQRPPAVNTTHSGKYKLTNRKSDEVSNTDQNLKPGKEFVHVLITDKPDQTLDKWLGEEKLNETIILQNPNHSSNPTDEANPSMSKYIQKIPTFKPEPTSEYKSTPKPNQIPSNEFVGTLEENMEQEITNSPDLTSGQKDIGEQPHTSPDNTNDSTQNHFKPSQEFETETATPLTEAVDISEENSLQEPKYNPDLTPGQTYVPDQATVAPDQKKNSSQDRLKIKRKPESTQGSSSEYNKIETSTKPPKQTLLTEPLKKSNKNPSHDPKSNPDVRPGWTSAPDQPAITHHLKNKSSQGIPETKHKRKPKPSKPKSQRSETTASPKPNQKFLTHVGDKSEENLTRKSKNPSDLTPRLEVISDRANTTLDYMDESSQESHKTKYKPENNREYKFEKANNSDENSLQEFISHPHLTPGQTSALDQATKHSDQITKSGEDHLEKTHKSENIQGFKSNKSETANTRPSTKSVGMSEEKFWQDPTPNPGLRPHRGTTSPDQIKKSIEDHLKSENIHKIKFNKSGTATSKPIQKLFPESVDQSEEIQEPTPYPDLTARQTSAPNQATTIPDQINKYNRKHLKPQTSQDAQSPTVTQKTLIESRDRFQEKTLQKPTSDPGQPPAETSTIDLATATTYWVIKTSEDHLKTKENKEKIHDFTSNQNKAATPKPKQKLLPETVEENSLQQAKLYPDLAHGQTPTPGQAMAEPDHMDAFNNEYIETQTSKEFKFYKSETASQKPSTKTWDKSKEISLQEPRPTLDLAPAVPNQTKKSTNSDSQTKHSHVTKFNKSEKRPKPLTESWEKSEEASLHEPTSKPGLAPDEISTSALSTATTGQITKTIQDRHGAKQNPGNNKGFKSNKSDTATPKSNQKPSSESKSKEQEHKNKSESTYDSAEISPDKRSKPGSNVAKFSKTPKPGQENRQNQKNPKVNPNLKTRPNANFKTNQTKQTNPRLKPLRPGLTTDLKPISVPEKIIKPADNKTSRLRLPFRHKPSIRPIVRPGAKLVQRPKQAVQPKPSPQTNTNPPQISWVPSGNIQNSRTDMPPTSGLVKQIAKVSHTLGETEFSTSVRKTITLSPKTSNSLKNGYFSATHTQTEDVTSSPNTRITSDPRPQTARLLSSVITRPSDINRRIFQNVITSTGPGATQLSVAPKSKAKTHREEESPHAVSPPSLKTTTTLSPKFRSKTSSTSGPEPLPVEMSTPSPRELRVKINQVAAFVNSSLIPNRRPDKLPKEQPKESQIGERTDGKLPTSAASAVIRDCSDHLLRGKTRSGLYLVTPDLRSSSFQVFCDMELDGGGWTLLQRRQDGSVSFNRPWVEYQAGFGVLDGGEFWLGNNKMHLLTRDRDMELRVELEDFDGVTEHAQYEHFRVASERLRYRLTVGGYSGTAGDALRFSKTYDHNNRAFTTPDRDNDRYPSGNCGAYYSSGWWFDACMAANLNGKYYFGKYKGVRDGIFWGTWHNISTEYYPTNERQSFKSVRMMTRPKSFGLR
ncbi:mucin-5AC-like isoform X1 [Poecilia formosa]|uniref:mucin-5AC-like isoform X1 n=1 Tax=Poecilia formosa TaxID=48698 RepID=UPI000444275A|nr:PREDICTED: mucin-5AC-like isoform X1 [Poecilia formosa]